MDRITRAERTPSLPRPERVVPEPVVDGHLTKLPASTKRLEDPVANTDTGLSRPLETVEAARRPDG
jgi:hypothetical protein